MLKIIDQAAMQAGTTNSRIGFAREGSGAWKVWDRYLTVDGKRAYHLGNVHQTCEFLFERLDGARTSINVENTAQALVSGIRAISDPAVAQVGAGLPGDDYVVCLSEAMLQLVRPGQPNDYFVKEQTALWGTDRFWDLPHDPRVSYYRAGEVSLGERMTLYQFVIPMFPESPCGDCRRRSSGEETRGVPWRAHSCVRRSQSCERASLFARDGRAKNHCTEPATYSEFPESWAAPRLSEGLAGRTPLGWHLFKFHGAIVMPRIDPK